MLHAKYPVLFGLALAFLGSAPDDVGSGLGEEAFGNKAVRNNKEWPKGLLSCVNDKQRVYRQWVNGNENFYFQGKLAQLNAAIATFAKIELPKRVLVLEPGVGVTRSFGKKKVPYRWRINAPSGLYRAFMKRKSGGAPTARMFVRLDKMNYLPSELMIPASIHLETPCLKTKRPTSTDGSSGKVDKKHDANNGKRGADAKAKKAASRRRSKSEEDKESTADKAAAERKRHALTFVRKVRRLWEKTVRARKSSQRPDQDQRKSGAKRD